jgi:hypothetical protein
MVNTPRAEKFVVTSTVGYVSETWPDSIKTSKTFAKKMRVTVTSPYLKTSVILEFVYMF